MDVTVYLPFLISGLFGCTAPALARRLPPAVATWLLSVGGLLAAAGSTGSLALLAFTLVAQNKLVAARGGWSDATLRQADPVVTPISLLALGILALVLARSTLAGVQRLVALRAAYRLAAALPAPGGELAVIDGPRRQAYAVPGRPGRIVMSTALLRALNSAERRAVLAHERAHLEHRHHLHHTVTLLAAAANPLLGRLPSAVAMAAERWADESAAQSCARGVVADALARAATSGLRVGAVPGVVLGAAHGDVLTRIAALRGPAPRLAVWRVGLLIGLLAASISAVLNAAQEADRLLDVAQAAYRATGR